MKRPIDRRLHSSFFSTFSTYRIRIALSIHFAATQSKGRRSTMSSPKRRKISDTHSSKQRDLLARSAKLGSALTHQTLAQSHQDGQADKG